MTGLRYVAAMIEKDRQHEADAIRRAENRKRSLQRREAAANELPRLPNRENSTGQ